MITAAIYVRVSSEEQVKGYSIPAQIEKCKTKAKELGATEILEFKDEGVSGSVLSRPGLTSLREAIKAGAIDLIVVYDPDRFARNVSHQLIVTEEIEKAGLRLEFVNFDWQKTPEGQMFYTIRGAISQYEREKIRERTMSGRIQKAKQGKMPHGHKPYGYNYCPEKETLVVNEREAEVVQSIFQMFVLENMGYNGIARELNEKRIPTKKGVGIWHRNVVKQIITNEVYTGIFYANRYNCRDVGLNKFKSEIERVRPTIRDRTEWIKIDVPQIISEDLWNQAQGLVREAKSRWNKWNHSRQYLLSGLVKCGECNINMYGHYVSNWGKKYRYYSCNNNSVGAKNPGCKKRIRAEQVEDTIWKFVQQLISNPEKLVASIKNTKNFKALNKDKETFAKEIEKISKAKKGILGLFEKQLISEHEIEERLNNLQEQENCIKSRIREIEVLLNKYQIDLGGHEKIVNVARNVLEQLEELEFAEKQKLVRLIIRRIIINGTSEINIHSVFGVVENNK